MPTNPALLIVNGRITPGFSHRDGKSYGPWYPHSVQVDPLQAWQVRQYFADNFKGQEIYLGSTGGPRQSRRPYDTLDEVLRAFTRDINPMRNSQEYERVVQVVQDLRLDRNSDGVVDLDFISHYRAVRPEIQVVHDLLKWAEAGNLTVAAEFIPVIEKRYDADEIAAHEPLVERIASVLDKAR